MKKISVFHIVGILILAFAACNQTAPVSGISDADTDVKYTSEPSGSFEESSGKEQTRDPEHVIEDFPVILQNPELPTGCEITAMTMVLNYYGYDVDKVTMAGQYLPCTPFNLYYGKDGKLYGSDMNRYFVGDPFSTGYICGTSAIVTAANNYLRDCGSPMEAVDKTGASPEEIYELVSNDVPVVVWATISMEDRRTPQGWYTENEEYVDWSTNDHGVVLIGCTEDTVVIADPISGQVEYDQEVFEQVFYSRNNQCVILT